MHACGVTPNVPTPLPPVFSVETRKDAHRRSLAHLEFGFSLYLMFSPPKSRKDKVGWWWWRDECFDTCAVCVYTCVCACVLERRRE